MSSRGGSRWTRAKAEARSSRGSSSSVGGNDEPAAARPPVAPRPEPEPEQPPAVAPRPVDGVGAPALGIQKPSVGAGGMGSGSSRYGQDADPTSAAAPRFYGRKDYDRLRPFQLKLICRDSGLPEHGSTEQLIERLKARDRGDLTARLGAGEAAPPGIGATRPAAGRIKLNAEFASIGPEHSNTRRVFERSFTRDLAEKLQISEERIRILAVTEGSIIVKFEIAAPPAGQYDPEPTAEQAIDTLAVKVSSRAIGDLGGAPVSAF